MTPARFRQIGALLYGAFWKGPLANELGNAVRTVQRWADGTTAPIPGGVDKQLVTLCRQRATDLLNAADELEGKAR